jgi:hypothetical protein
MKPIHQIALALTLGIAAISLAPLAQAQTDRYEALAKQRAVYLPLRINAPGSPVDHYKDKKA